MIKTAGPKEYKDPSMNALVKHKANWNKEVSNNLADLYVLKANIVNLKWLLNGWPSKYDRKKNKITEPLPGDPLRILEHLTQQYAQFAEDFKGLAEDGKSIVVEQENFAKSRKKASIENRFELLSEALVGDRLFGSTPMSRTLSRITGPYFGTDQEKLLFKYKNDSLNLASDLNRSTKKFRGSIIGYGEESVQKSEKFLGFMYNEISLLMKKIADAKKSFPELFDKTEDKVEELKEELTKTDEEVIKKYDIKNLPKVFELSNDVEKLEVLNFDKIYSDITDNNEVKSLLKDFNKLFTQYKKSFEKDKLEDLTDIEQKINDIYSKLLLTLSQVSGIDEQFESVLKAVNKIQLKFKERQVSVSDIDIQNYKEDLDNIQKLLIIFQRTGDTRSERRLQTLLSREVSRFNSLITREDKDQMTRMSIKQLYLTIIKNIIDIPSVFKYLKDLDVSNVNISEIVNIITLDPNKTEAFSDFDGLAEINEYKKDFEENLDKLKILTSPKTNKFLLNSHNHDRLNAISFNKFERSYSKSLISIKANEIKKALENISKTKELYDDLIISILGILGILQGESFTSSIAGIINYINTQMPLLDKLSNINDELRSVNFLKANVKNIITGSSNIDFRAVQNNIINLISNIKNLGFYDKRQQADKIIEQYNQLVEKYSLNNLLLSYNNNVSFTSFSEVIKAAEMMAAASTTASPSPPASKQQSGEPDKPGKVIQDKPVEDVDPTGSTAAVKSEPIISNISEEKQLLSILNRLKQDVDSIGGRKNISKQIFVDDEKFSNFINAYTAFYREDETLKNEIKNFINAKRSLNEKMINHFFNRIKKSYASMLTKYLKMLDLLERPSSEEELITNFVSVSDLLKNKKEAAENLNKFFIKQAYLGRLTGKFLHGIKGLFDIKSSQRVEIYDKTQYLLILIDQLMISFEEGYDPDKFKDLLSSIIPIFNEIRASFLNLRKEFTYKKSPEYTSEISSSEVLPPDKDLDAARRRQMIRDLSQNDPMKTFMKEMVQEVKKEISKDKDVLENPIESKI